MAAAGSLSLAAPQRVVMGVHGHTSDRRPDPKPARPTGLPQRDVLVVQVPDLADDRHTVEGDPTDFTRGKFHQAVLALLGQELHPGPRTSRQLGSLSNLQLDVMKRHPHWN